MANYIPARSGIWIPELQYRRVDERFWWLYFQAEVLPHLNTKFSSALQNVNCFHGRGMGNYNATNNFVFTTSHNKILYFNLLKDIITKCFYSMKLGYKCYL